MDQYEMMEEVAEQFSEYTNSIVRYNSAGFYVLAKDETELVQWKLMWL